MVFWEAGKLRSGNLLLLQFSGTVEIIYPKLLQNLSELKYLEYQFMELSGKLVSAVFPEFHRVASFMVFTLHPTNINQV